MGLRYRGARGRGGGARGWVWCQCSHSLPSVLAGVVQSIKDHITKPTAMARGRVAHLIEWKGWRAQRSGWELSPADDEHYCCLPDELREARFAAGPRVGAGEPGDGDWLGLWFLGDRGSPHGRCRGRANRCRGVAGALGGPGWTARLSARWSGPARGGAEGAPGTLLCPH